MLQMIQAHFQLMFEGEYTDVKDSTRTLDRWKKNKQHDENVLGEKPNNERRTWKGYKEDLGKWITRDKISSGTYLSTVI